MLEDQIKIAYSFVDQHSDFYIQAVRLRYKVFFEPFKVSMDNVYDSIEAESYHLVAYYDNLIVGYGRLTVKDIFAQISQMVVDASFRKEGIGSGLMQSLIEKALYFDPSIIFLNAKIDAIGLYRKFGFVSVGEDFPSPKTGLPHRRMEKKCK